MRSESVRLLRDVPDRCVPRGRAPRRKSLRRRPVKRVAACDDAFVDFFQHARDDREEIRMDLAHVVADPLQALGVIDRHADVEVGVRQRALEDVAERQKRNRPLGRGSPPMSGTMAMRVAHEVGVREHDTFGLAGGAGGVDERRQVLGAHGGGRELRSHARTPRSANSQTRAPVAEFAVQTCAPAAGLSAVGPLVEIDASSSAWVVCPGKMPATLAWSASLETKTSRAPESSRMKRHSSGGQRGIDRDVHRAELENGEVEDVPLRTVGFGDVGHAVAGAHACRVQAGGDGAGGFDDL